MAGASRMSVSQAEQRIKQLRPYMKKGQGGITASGGEPTLQPDFLRELFRLAHQLGVTTALDTNGSCPPSKAPGILNHTDTVLLDVKASTEELHKWLTGQPLAPTAEFGRRVSERQKKTGSPVLIVRRVILPGLNDTEEEMQALVKYLKGLPVTPAVELIPYHKMGMHKWKELGLEYELTALKPPRSECINRIKRRLVRADIPVL